MDKYEEALSRLAHGASAYKGFTVAHDFQDDFLVLQAALEKVRKFDQLVEARKKTTPGEWESKKLEIHSSKYLIAALFVEKVREYFGNWGECKYPKKDDEAFANAAFITLAANLTGEK